MTTNRRRRRKSYKRNTLVYIIEALILMTAAGCLSVIGSPNSADILGILCICLASALFACAMFLSSPGIIILTGAAATFTITLLLYGDIITAFASLIYIAAASFIYFGVMSKQSRTQITFRIAVALAVIFVLLIVFYFISNNGSFSVSMVTSYIDSELSELARLYLSSYDEVIAEYMADMYPAADVLLIEETVKSIVSDLKAMVPAFYVLFNLIAAYISTAVFRMAYNIFIPIAKPYRKKIRNTYWRVHISTVSAIIMTLAMIFSLLLSEEPIPWLAATNIVYILMPGFSVMGIYFAKDRIFKSGFGIIPIVLIIGAAIFLVMIPIDMFYVLSLVSTVFMGLGVYAALEGDMKKLWDKTKKYVFGDDDDDDDFDDFDDFD